MENYRRNVIICNGYDYNNDNHCDYDGYFVSKDGKHKPALIKREKEFKKLYSYYLAKGINNYFYATGKISGLDISVLNEYSLDQEFNPLSSGDLNYKLREKLPLTSQQVYRVHVLDKIIEKFKLTKSITVFRGIAINYSKNNKICNLNIGDEYSDYSYKSTSYDLSTASAYAFYNNRDTCVICKIILRKNINCIPLTIENGTAGCGEECEILLSRKVHFYVKGKEVSYCVGKRLIVYEMEAYQNED